MNDQYSAQQQSIDQEVRIRLLEKIASGIDKNFDKIDEKFQKIDEKMDSHFQWVLGTVIALILSVVTLFGGVILHLAKLI